jgi:hypothetical protein
MAIQNPRRLCRCLPTDILAITSAVTLAAATLAFLTPREKVNNVAILCCCLTTALGFAFVAGPCLRTLQIAKAIFLLGALMSFWLGAWRCTYAAYVPQSQSILGEIGGRWKPSTVATAVLYVAIFQCFGLAGYYIAHMPDKCKRFLLRPDRPGPFSHEAVGHVLIVLMLATFYYRYGSSTKGLVEGLVASRTSYEQARQIGLLANFVWLGYYGVALLALRQVRALTASQPILTRLPLLVLPAIGFLVVCMDGTRHHLLYIVTPVSLLLAHAGVRKDKKYLTALAATTVLVLIVYQLQTVSRDIGWHNLRSKDRSQFISLRGTDQFQSLLYAVEIVPGRHGYFRSPASPFFLTHWIPRQLWASKPCQPEIVYLSTEWTGAELYESNVTPSIIGQYHMNWGVAGVAWAGLMLGWMFKCVDILLRSTPLMGYTHLWTLLGMFVAFLIASFRCLTPTYFMFPLFGFVIFILCTNAGPENRTLEARTSDQSPGYSN